MTDAPLPEDAGTDPVTPVVLRRLALLSALPFVGFILFAIGGVLALVTFSHNGSPLECSGTFVGTPPCPHHSYVLAIVLLVVGIVVLMGGGILASYYAARRVGLPLATALMQRRRIPQGSQASEPAQPPFTPPEA
jgi:hypothetical protein